MANNENATTKKKVAMRKWLLAPRPDPTPIVPKKRSPKK
jgi:hypothetical protein